MPKVAIRLADSPYSDLKAVRDGYAEQGVPDVGERLLREIIASIEAPAEHPERGRNLPAFGQPFLRELIRPPRVPMPPEVVAINPAPPADIETTSPLENEIVPAELPIITSRQKEPSATWI